MAYELRISEELQDKLIDIGLKLSTHQRTILKKLLKRIKKDPRSGDFHQPLPIVVSTDFYIKKGLGENMEILIGYDILETVYNGLVTIRVIRFSHFKIHDI